VRTDLPTGTGRSPAAIRGALLPSHDELAVREQRLAALRDAARAQAPSSPDTAMGPEAAALERVVSEIRSSAGALRDAASRLRESGTHRSALAELDVGLERFAEAIRTRVAETPMEKLAPRLASRAGVARADLLALLDVMIADEGAIAARHERLDLLLLLLATEERNGRRQVVRDPATLTPALQAVAARMAASDGDDLARVEADFVAAARRCQQNAAPSDLAAMRARRAELGSRGFAPQAMRGIVFFNAATSDLGRIAPDAPVASEAVIAPQPASAPDAASATKDTVGRAPQAARAPIVQWKIETAAAVPVAPPKPARRSRVGRRGVSATFAACVVAAIFLLPANPDAAHVLSKEELGSVSSVLASAYRDGKRSGPLFIATVTTEWKRLSRAARQQSGDQIFAKLEPTGVRELMLYDASHRLVLHQSTAFPTRIAD
jgi:hypothetical protein